MIKKFLFTLVLLAAACCEAGVSNPPVNQASVAITGGTINGTAIGATTPANIGAAMINMNGATTTGIFAGEIGFPNNAALRWRNAANGAYLNGVYVDSSNNLQFGGNAVNSVVATVAGTGTVGTFSSTGLAVVGALSTTSTFKTGASSLTLTTGAIGMSKMTASASAPGAGGAKLEVVCGTNAGTAKLIMYAGTSTTAVTVVDNVGTGVTGC